MSRQLPMAAAINEALHVALASDPTVIVLGEDVAGGGGRADQGIEEAWGGIMGATLEFSAAGSMTYSYMGRTPMQIV